MVAMLAFGGTFAYFTATTEEDTASLKTGVVQLTSQDIATVENTKVVPGQDVCGEISVTDNSNVASYIFVIVSATSSAGTEVTSAEDLAEGKFMLTFKDTTWELLTGEGVTGKVYYKETAGVTTATKLTVASGVKYDAVSTSSEAAAGTLMNNDLTVTIRSTAIQKEGFTSALLAYNQVKTNLAID